MYIDDNNSVQGQQIIPRLLRRVRTLLVARYCVIEHRSLTTYPTQTFSGLICKNYCHADVMVFAMVRMHGLILTKVQPRWLLPITNRNACFSSISAKFGKHWQKKEGVISKQITVCFERRDL